MQANDWIEIIVLGGLLGMIGQGARAVVGLKKVNDQAGQTSTSFAAAFETSRLVVSLVIGFIAGALAALAVAGAGESNPNPKLTIETVFGLAAAGYAGTDFIEGFVKRNFSSTTPTAGGGQPPAYG